MKPILITTLFLVALPALATSCSDNQTPVPTHPAYDGGAVVTALPCVPNLDGKIESRELVPQVGIPASYLVNPAGKERTVDVVGQTNNGKLAWNFGFDFADDQVAKIEAQNLDGKWYAASFAGAANAVVVAADLAGRTEGVYTQDDTGFFLHGIASSLPSPPEGQTLLVYTTPVMLYRFPLQAGGAWSSVGEVKNGMLRGLPFASRDTYDVKVDGSGELGLPDFVLTQVLRVRTNVSISPSAGALTTQRQVGFLFECLGEVTRATSKLNEPDENFTTASELRRLGLAP
ncbi:MAG: hypothetical protein JWO86_4785 [Myxococcaceae bacterium]|jgi:hypothetical protein|nr:hypothetical protein [Myxococcaceae bacterium]